MSKKQYQPWTKKHPDREEIIDRLQTGYNVLDIITMLKERYPLQSELWLKHEALYTYRKKHFPELAKKKREDMYVLRAENKAGKGTRLSKEVKGVILPEGSDIATKIMILTNQIPPEAIEPKALSDDQLVSWTKGLDGFTKFAEEMTVERGKPVKLQEYQKQIAKLFIENSRVCINAGGQVGKDFIMQEFMLWTGIVVAGSTQMLVCATQSQSVALMNRILACARSSKDLNDTIADKGMKPDPTIYFKNGSRILFLTAKSLIAGFTALSIIYVNEARDINEEEVTRVSPLLGIGEGKLFVLSRPRFRRGYFWDCFSNPVFKTMQIPTEWNIHYSKKTLEENRATMSADLFRIEHLAEFADAGSAYISETAIKKCSRIDFEYKSMVRDPDYEYCLGMDWARLRDTCVLTVLGQHKQTKQKKIFHLFSFDPDGGGTSSFSHQFAYINLLDDKFNFTKIIPESSGMGIPLCEALEKEWRNAGKRSNVIKPYENRSLNTKLFMYDNLKRVIENDEIEIPRGAARLINELMMVQFGTSAQGTLKLETPITDDYADSLALANMGFVAPFKAGVSVLKTMLGELKI